MKIEIYRGRTSVAQMAGLTPPLGDWRWRMKAPNGKIVAEGGEGYKRIQTMVNSVKKYIVRGDPLMNANLRRALIEQGFLPSAVDSPIRTKKRA